ncbi:MAG: ECF transporter S component [Deltaproteobacteria bacterium]|jgi:energy-coupling factor transport system substrate-specific component|nr:ECF transporter S component [Deltaproteobacteria bacterium]
MPNKTKQNWKLKSGWKLKDVIMVGIVSIVFAVVYLGAVYLGIFLSTLMMPTGLSPIANEPIYGIWFMAATFIAFILRKPGAAIVTEMLAALLEVLMGSMYGPLVFVDGAIQGLGAEMVFAAFGYRNFSLKVMGLAGIAAAILSFIWDFFRSGFLMLSPWLLLAMIVIRILSGWFFAGCLSLKLAQALEATGVLKAWRGQGA